MSLFQLEPQLNFRHFDDKSGPTLIVFESHDTIMSVAAGPFHLPHMDPIKHAAMSNQILEANLWQVMTLFNWSS
jgi:hypothetical protein